MSQACTDAGQLDTAWQK